MAVVQPAVPATAVPVVNNTGDLVGVTVTGGTVQGLLSTPPVGPTIAQPAVPASTGTVTNNNNFPVAVTVSGGTVTVIAVNGTTIYTATGNTVIVPIGGTIGLTYSVAPTWVWTPLYAGQSGNPLSSPQVIGVLPGGSVTMLFTVAPTWAWINPPDYSFEGYAFENTVDNNELTLPWAQPHPEAGEPGLGTGVSN